MNDATDQSPSARDRLATIRTELANERTFLAYFRTALALIVGAITARQLLLDPVFQRLALALGLMGAVILAVGVYRFARTRRDVFSIGAR